MLEPTNYKVTVSSVAAEVTLDMLREHLYIYNNDEDSYLSSLILTAQEIAHNYLGEFISPSTVQADYTEFDRELVLPHKNVRSVTSVAYLDDSDASNTVADTMYVLDNTQSPMRNPIVRLRNGEDSWTSDMLSRDFSAPVSITYEAGIVEDAAFTNAKLHAIMLICADLYRDRENVSPTRYSNAYVTAERILAPHRRRVL